MTSKYFYSNFFQVDLITTYPRAFALLSLLLTCYPPYHSFYSAKFFHDVKVFFIQIFSKWTLSQLIHEPLLCCPCFSHVIHLITVFTVRNFFMTSKYFYSNFFQVDLITTYPRAFALLSLLLTCYPPYHSFYSLLLYNDVIAASFSILNIPCRNVVITVIRCE